MYKLLYTNKGDAIGWLSFTSTTTVAGAVDWIKPFATSGRYAAGFNTLLRLTGTKLQSPPVMMANPFLASMAARRRALR